MIILEICKGIGIRMPSYPASLDNLLHIFIERLAFQIFSSVEFRNKTIDLRGFLLQADRRRAMTLAWIQVVRRSRELNWWRGWSQICIDFEVYIGCACTDANALFVVFKGLGTSLEQLVPGRRCVL